MMRSSNDGVATGILQDASISRDDIVQSMKHLRKVVGFEFEKLNMILSSSVLFSSQGNVDKALAGDLLKQVRLSAQRLDDMSVTRKRYILSDVKSILKSLVVTVRTLLKNGQPTVANILSGLLLELIALLDIAVDVSQRTKSAFVARAASCYPDPSHSQSDQMKALSLPFANTMSPFRAQTAFQQQLSQNSNPDASSPFRPPPRSVTSMGNHSPRFSRRQNNGATTRPFSSRGPSSPFMASPIPKPKMPLSSRRPSSSHSARQQYHHLQQQNQQHVPSPLAANNSNDVDVNSDPKDEPPSPDVTHSSVALVDPYYEKFKETQDELDKLQLEFENFKDATKKAEKKHELQVKANEKRIYELNEYAKLLSQKRVKNDPFQSDKREFEATLSEMESSSVKRQEMTAQIAHLMLKNLRTQPKKPTSVSIGTQLLPGDLDPPKIEDMSVPEPIVEEPKLKKVPKLMNKYPWCRHLIKLFKNKKQRPWADPKNASVPTLQGTISSACAILRDKATNDAADTSGEGSSETLGSYLITFFITKYGLRSLAQKNLGTFLMGLTKFSAKNPEEYCLQVFSKMCLMSVPCTCTRSLTGSCDCVAQESLLFEQMGRRVAEFFFVFIERCKKKRPHEPETIEGVMERSEEVPLYICMGAAMKTAILPSRFSSSQLQSILEHATLPGEEGGPESNSMVYKQSCFALERLKDEMSNLGLQPKDFFNLMDADGNATLDREEFLAAIDGLKLQITQSDASLIFSLIDNDESGEIDHQEFRRICQQRRLVIGVWRFLDSALHILKDSLGNVETRLRVLFDECDENKDCVLELSEFTTLVNRVNPNLRQRAIVRMFQEALDTQEELSLSNGDDVIEVEDAISPDAFVLVARQNGLMPTI
eukprot:TRINITY_DN250_c0_g2_i1.p1 TRINITY_DN250_c0_g2~~TRINITY_DN250_c0_g2_i1.p1  ORF type:complete len:880 (+),score=264.92 TRINITY_DN250_c0_g2_i1:147-2786(+)